MFAVLGSMMARKLADIAKRGREERRAESIIFIFVDGCCAASGGDKIFQWEQKEEKGRKKKNTRKRLV